ncbi:MAG: hypothetical protein AAF289_08165 [Cyanobacteria bacterium P01_A01_bin.135]
MREPKILKLDQGYTFARYAELPYERDDILKDLGCSIATQALSLPTYGGELNLQDLSDRLTAAFQFTTISSEQARREFLIAPLLTEVCQHTQQKVRVEYPLTVSNWLKGSFDYYFQANNFLVIKAISAEGWVDSWRFVGPPRCGGPTKPNHLSGFTQLGAELLALDQWTESEVPVLYGAVSTGQIWQFGVLHRQEKHLVEDPTLYRVPQELEVLTRILIGIVSGPV